MIRLIFILILAGCTVQTKEIITVETVTDTIIEIRIDSVILYDTLYLQDVDFIDSAKYAAIKEVNEYRMKCFAQIDSAKFVYSRWLDSSLSTRIYDNMVINGKQNDSIEIGFDSNGKPYLKLL